MPLSEIFGIHYTYKSIQRYNKKTQVSNDKSSQPTKEPHTCCYGRNFVVLPLDNNQDLRILRSNQIPAQIAIITRFNNMNESSICAAIHFDCRNT